jgi:isopentenyl diphosphate isomerase/L-lactate dehydrogenase-like FMN-dependent dehydrogenase
VKGIATAEDATIAVDHGVDVVWVSNHGGRQLDHGQATIDMLPEVAQAVNGRAQIVLDGGIQRGTDVLKAIALGANAVAIGKLQGWGLGAGGEAGLFRTLELLEEEIAIDMALIGVTSLDQLNAATHLTTVASVMLPHEMSSWSHIEGGRLV